jgi:hypothetical protein
MHTHYINIFSLYKVQTHVKNTFNKGRTDVNTIIEKNQQKHLVEIEPVAPKLNVLIKHLKKTNPSGQ